MTLAISLSLTTAFAASVVAEPSSDAHANPPSGTQLDTADERRVEALALQILATPEVRQARQQVTALFDADPIAGTRDGATTLPQAVAETVFAVALNIAADDPLHPAIFWDENAAHDWHGIHVPGSRNSIDNPDNVYRGVFVDGTGHFRIDGRARGNHRPTQFTFELLDSAPGINGPGKQIQLLKDSDIQLDTDGRFTITVDPEPAKGRPNHIQTNTAARFILIRDTLGDWSSETPNTLDIRRLDSAPVQPRDLHQLALRAAEVAPSFTSFLLTFRDHFLAQKAFHRQVNTLSIIDPREGGWGYAGGARFRLKDDEALLVRVSPLGARYLGFQLADPWMVSTDYIHRTGSLNNHQAVANTDGTVTYIIAAQDPSVANWLDTGGLHEGFLQLRWQQLPAQIDAGEAVRQARVVKLSELRALLPAATATVSPQQRQDQLAARLTSYNRRLED